MRAVGTMQAAWHDILIVQAPLPPALAKNARTGHPFPDRERKKAERLGHPPPPARHSHPQSSHIPSSLRRISIHTVGPSMALPPDVAVKHADTYEYYAEESFL